MYVSSKNKENSFTASQWTASSPPHTFPKDIEWSLYWHGRAKYIYLEQDFPGIQAFFFFFLNSHSRQRFLMLFALNEASYSVEKQPILFHDLYRDNIWRVDVMGSDHRLVVFVRKKSKVARTFPQPLWFVKTCHAQPLTPKVILAIRTGRQLLCAVIGVLICSIFPRASFVTNSHQRS